LLFFFFQADDGIRDFHVTGVQTCALPIYTLSPKVNFPPESYNPTHPETPGGIVDLHDVLEEMALRRDQPFDIDLSQVLQAPELRSEEHTSELQLRAKIVCRTQLGKE